jgi:para-nitrobenzyl esterase
VNEEVVEVKSGRLRGEAGDGLTAFLGVPFAASPAGSGRFSPPRPPESWRGVRQASEFGAVAPQATSGIGSYLPGDPLDQDEECLFVNVWAPSPRGERLPVMVYVHGGAFMNGAGSSILYRPTRLARRGAVVVTFNYRIGALGFLAHRCLFDQQSGGFGNWGLLDQIAALSWVRENVSAFGGDPENVTVFGQSAGAMAVSDLIATGGAHSLFRRAIIQSGAPIAASPAASSAVAEQLFAQLGISDPDRQSLSLVPVDELIEAQSSVNSEIDGGIGLPFQPVIDGGLISLPPEDAIASGASSSVEILGGWNRDEFALFSFAALAGREFGAQDLEGLVRRYLRGSGVDESLALPAIETYAAARSERREPASERAILDAIIRDWIFRIPFVRMTEAHVRNGGRAFLYEFDWPSPFAGGALGACHGIELPFVFGTVHEPIVGLFAGASDEAFKLAEAVQSSWIGFAISGDPSSELTGPWPLYQPPERAAMRIGSKIEVTRAPREEERSFWELRLGRYGLGGPIEGACRQGVAMLAPEDGSSGA